MSLTEPTYTVIIRGAGGDLIAFVDDYIELQYTNVVGDVGMAKLTLAADHYLHDIIELDSLIEVKRYTSEQADGPEPGGGTSGAPWHIDENDPQRDFQGAYRGDVTRYERDGRTVSEFAFPSLEEHAMRAIVAYPTGTNDRSEHTAEDLGDIVWNTLRYNLNGAESAVNTTGQGRVRAVSDFKDLYGFFDSDVTIDYANAWKSVFTCYQELADYAGFDPFIIWWGDQNPGGDYSIYYINGRNNGNGPLFSVPRHGTDRRSEVIFHVGAGNIEAADIDQRRIGYPTVAIVGGRGQGSDRNVVVRTSDDYVAFTNNIERFVDARHLTTTAALEDYGDAYLEKNKYSPTIEVSTMQAPGYKYGKDYFFGDDVRVRVAGQTVDVRIMSVTVTHNAQGERVTFELGRSKYI